ncbi:MAG: endonuclease [Candidatus Edwardsbacteria bacterium]|nr:endonuclease [Candidatus Edwardsbacteria bacterium]
MKKLLIAIILLAAPALLQAGTVPPDSTIFPGLKGAQLMDSLVANYRAPSNLGYNNARDTMYGIIDKDGNDSLRCIYSGYSIKMQAGQDPSTWAYNNGIDCEHTWPQSSFSQSALPRADLHHLFPTQYSPVPVNGDRGDSPFRTIPVVEVDYWYRYTEKTATAPAAGIQDQYSKNDQAGGGSWETRLVQKGNTARSIFYFYNMYKASHPAIETWWQGQLPYISDLLQWHMADPADAAEITRTRKIASYQQGKKNPFVLDSTLIRRAYFPTMGVASIPGMNPVALTTLSQNSPNPFRASAVIRYSLAKPSIVRLGVYNVLGQAVYTTQPRQEAAGTHVITWNGRAMPQGVYFYQLMAGNEIVATRRMTLIK